MWKRAVTAAALALSVGPAFASDTGGTAVAAATVPSRAVTQGTHAAAAIPSRSVTDLNNAAAIRDLSTRLNSLEQKVDNLTPPPPTPEELKQAKIDQEREAEFVQHVWTDG